MSLYAEYIRERTTDLIFENEHSFATYRFMDEGRTVYIIDLFVKPEFRRSHIASSIADSIVAIAREKSCTKLLGSVVPSNKNSNDSLKVLLGYGMTLDSSTNDFILFRKDI